MATKAERFMAIFIGVIMLGSVAGFALMSVNMPTGNDAPEIPVVVDRALTTDEILYVLRSGRVLIEDFYTTDFPNYLERNMLLESFAGRFSDFVVLERVMVNQTNETMLQMIGSGGRIVKLENTTINDSSLLDVFCGIAMAQPMECLL